MRHLTPWDHDAVTPMDCDPGSGIFDFLADCSLPTNRWSLPGLPGSALPLLGRRIIVSVLGYVKRVPLRCERVRSFVRRNAGTEPCGPSAHPRKSRAGAQGSQARHGTAVCGETSPTFHSRRDRQECLFYSLRLMRKLFTAH